MVQNKQENNKIPVVVHFMEKLEAAQALGRQEECGKVKKQRKVSAEVLVKNLDKVGQSMYV